MDTVGIKIHVIQYATLIAVFTINAILTYSFYQLVLMGNIHNVLNFTFKLSDFFFLFVTIYLLIANSSIPFQRYNDEDDIDDQIADELSILTTHIFLSSIIMATAVVGMYCFNL